MKSSGRMVLLLLFVIFCGFVTSFFFPKLQSEIAILFHKVKPLPTPTPLWKEQTVQLSKEEQATMSGNFLQEIQTVIATISSEKKASEAPLRSQALGVASTSATNDTVPPTVSITGGPNEHEEITGTHICFPLWVSDNVTNYQKLITHTKLDGNEWTNWEINLAPCFDVTQGAHTITIQVKDEAENVSPEVQRHFVTK